MSNYWNHREVISAEKMNNVENILTECLNNNTSHTFINESWQYNITNVYVNNNPISFFPPNNIYYLKIIGSQIKVQFDTGKNLTITASLDNSHSSLIPSIDATNKTVTVDCSSLTPSQTTDIILTIQIADADNSSVPSLTYYFHAEYYGTTITISDQPANVTAEIGDTETFSVTASTSTSSTLYYQWQNKSINGTTWHNSGLSGNQTSQITIPVIESRYKYVWRCKVSVSETDYIYTNEVQIKDPTKIYITTNLPLVKDIIYGETYYLEVEAELNGNSSGLSYSWQYRRYQTEDGQPITPTNWQTSTRTGATSNTLTLAYDNSSVPNHEYRCEIKETAQPTNLIYSNICRLNDNTPSNA